MVWRYQLLLRFCIEHYMGIVISYYFNKSACADNNEKYNQIQVSKKNQFHLFGFILTFLSNRWKFSFRASLWLNYVIAEKAVLYLKSQNIY